MRNGVIQWQISYSKSMHFSLALTVLEILTFQIFYLENLGQGHEVHNIGSGVIR